VAKDGGVSDDALRCEVVGDSVGGVARFDGELESGTRITRRVDLVVDPPQHSEAGDPDDEAEYDEDDRGSPERTAATLDVDPLGGRVGVVDRRCGSRRRRRASTPGATCRAIRRSILARGAVT